MSCVRCRSPSYFSPSRIAELHTQPGERAQRGDLVQRLFHRRVAQRKPVLHQVHAQHRLRRIRSATTSDRRVVRLDQAQQRLPRHHRLHLFQEHLAPGLLALAGVLSGSLVLLQNDRISDRLRLKEATRRLSRKRLFFAKSGHSVHSRWMPGITASTGGALRIQP